MIGDEIMVLPYINEMNSIISLIRSTSDLLSDHDKQTIENMIIDFQSNNLLSTSLKTKHAFVNDNAQFSKLRYLEDSLKKHTEIITVALKNTHSEEVNQIILGLRRINIEAINEVESLTVTKDQLQPFIQTEYPPLREVINKYRCVISNCLLNLLKIKKIDSIKINQKELKKLADELN